jgi:Protein kinase domain
LANGWATIHPFSPLGLFPDWRPPRGFLVDLDCIFKWVHPGEEETYVRFWIAPVTMVFENAHAVRIDIESQLGAIEVADPFREGAEPRGPGNPSSTRIDSTAKRARSRKALRFKMFVAIVTARVPGTSTIRSPVCVVGCQRLYRRRQSRRPRATSGLMSTALRAREEFRPYRILALIGQGGGGVVYRAWDPRLQREVALKVLHRRRGGGPTRAERFVAEARAASALNHPNIVSVFDAAFDDDTPYIVSELIDGRTLRHEIGKAALPVRRVLDIAMQIADGLAAAHEAGIVHRDLKPENVMLTGSGRVKIVDFGLAQPAGFQLELDPPNSTDTQTQTDAGLRAGTAR